MRADRLILAACAAILCAGLLLDAGGGGAMLEALEPLMPDDGTPDRPALDRRTALLDHLRAPLPKDDDNE